MEAVFLKLVNMSITASYMVVAVLVLRLVLRRAPKSIHCVLWAMVALRLLCPVTLESSFSLVEPERTESSVDSFMDDYVGSYRIYWDITDEYQTALDAGIMPVRTEGGGSYVVTGTTTPASEPTLLVDILAPVWVVGIVLMALYAVISYLIVLRKVRVCIRVDKSIRLCDHIDTPFILGILRPKIYLPSDLDPMTATHVLAHEQAHLKRRDHWWKPLGFVLLSVHWFNPVMWLAYILLCRDIEQACDEKVVRELDSAGKKAYSQALLACSVPRRMVSACPLAFGEVGVKGRIKSVLNYKKPAFWIIVVAVIACIVAAVCFLTDPEDEGITPYEITSELWIYDTKTVDVTVWDDNGVHEVNLNRLEIEELSEIIHYLKEDEFVEEKPSEHKLYAVLHCEEFVIDLHWDGEFTYFTFDTATNARITSNRRSVKNEELNTFLTGVMEMEYRLAEGTYVPIEAASLYGDVPDVLHLLENRRYEVTKDGLTVSDLESGAVISYVFDWSWEGLAEAQNHLDSFTRVNYHDSFFDLRIKMDDTELKYQHLYDNCHLVFQDDTLYLIDGTEILEDGRINWTIYRLTEYSPYLIPPATYTEFFKNVSEYSNYSSSFIRSGDRRPGRFGLTDEETDKLSTILAQMPEDAIQPGGIIKDYYVTVSVGSSITAELSCDAYFWYYDGEVGLYWNSYASNGTQLYQIDYAPLAEFLAGMMQPDRIESYGIALAIQGTSSFDGLYQYITYTHEDISISLVKIIGWDYEIVPYVDDHTDFGIRCKPEWLDDWLFFGYMQGELAPESTFLHEANVGGSFQQRDEWHYLFENPIKEEVSWREWPEPWKMIYRYADGGTYYIYNEGAFDERLVEHDRGGYMFIENSFEFGLIDEETVIANSKYQIYLPDYENPEVTYDAGTCSYLVTWHRKDSDGYVVVRVNSVHSGIVTEVESTSTE